MTKSYKSVLLYFKKKIKNIKRFKKHISFLLLIFFLSPIILLSLHVFSNHEHAVCFSKIETHIHEVDVDCDLHLLKQNNTFFEKQDFKQTLLVFIKVQEVLKYNFLKNHHQLSFSLRGPPSSII